MTSKGLKTLFVVQQGDIKWCRPRRCCHWYARGLDTRHVSHECTEEWVSCSLEVNRFQNIQQIRVCDSGHHFPDWVLWCWRLPAGHLRAIWAWFPSPGSSVGGETTWSSILSLSLHPLPLYLRRHSYFTSAVSFSWNRLSREYLFLAISFCSLLICVVVWITLVSLPSRTKAVKYF